MTSGEHPAWVSGALGGHVHAGEALEEVRVVRAGFLRKLAFVRTSARWFIVDAGLLGTGVHLAPAPPPCPACGAALAPDPADPPGYNFKGFRLYKRQVEMEGGRREERYFFSMERPEDAMPCFVPAGFEVVEDGDSGVPYLRRGG